MITSVGQFPPQASAPGVLRGAMVWQLQDGTKVVAHFQWVDEWGWYSADGDLLDHMTREQAEHKIDSQHGTIRGVK